MVKNVTHTYKDIKTVSLTLVYTHQCTHTDTHTMQSFKRPSKKMLCGNTQ